MSVVDAALSAARLRFRPLMMTALAFILGCVPLWTASGAGAVARQIMGTAVIGGMVAETFIGRFFVPAIFYVVERISGAATRETPQLAYPRKPKAKVTNMKKLALLPDCAFARWLRSRTELQAANRERSHGLPRQRCPARLPRHHRSATRNGGRCIRTRC